MCHPRIVAILGLILLGIISRFIPHPPNFTAIGAIALLGTCSLRSFKLSLLTVFVTMLLSDSILGFHCHLLFVYLSYALIACMGYWFSPKKTLSHCALLLMASSLLFFLITNFGVWLTPSLYPQTLEGLGLCYLAATPFLINQILGSFFYSALIQLVFYSEVSNTLSLNIFSCSRK